MFIFSISYIDKIICTRFTWSLNLAEEDIKNQTINKSYKLLQEMSSFFEENT